MPAYPISEDGGLAVAEIQHGTFLFQNIFCGIENCVHPLSFSSVYRLRTSTFTISGCARITQSLTLSATGRQFSPARRDLRATRNASPVRASRRITSS